MTQRVTPEAGATEFFTDDHRRCDDLWAAVEAAGEQRDVGAARAAFTAFAAATRRHFEMEETVLFPAFEQASGMTMGPTQVMRAEHQQMRALLDLMAMAMAMAMTESDLADLLEQGDTLLMVTQQHNMKEEGMLYPMTERYLGGGAWPPIAQRLAPYLTAR